MEKNFTVSLFGELVQVDAKMMVEARDSEIGYWGEFRLWEKSRYGSFHIAALPTSPFKWEAIDFFPNHILVSITEVPHHRYGRLVDGSAQILFKGQEVGRGDKILVKL